MLKKKNFGKNIMKRSKILRKIKKNERKMFKSF